MNLQSFPRRKEQVIAQKASSDFLLFDMDHGGYYSLNEVASKIWELCDGTRSVAQIIDILAGEYDAAKEALTEDVVELVEQLRSDKLIVELAQGEPLIVSNPSR